MTYSKPELFVAEQALDAICGIPKFQEAPLDGDNETYVTVSAYEVDE